jgi:hypothetical protein
MTHQTWAAVQASVRGASHARRDLPNQDATGASPPGTTVVAAVADGHGDPRCCRADRGSRLAVRAALDVLLGVPARLGDSARANDALLHDVVVPDLVAAWQRLVEQDAAADPLTADEVALTTGSPVGVPGLDAYEWLYLSAAPAGEPGAAAETDPHAILRAYGTTFVGALACPGWLVLVQVGDGEIGVVLDSGEPLAPLPDDGHAGTATTSLALPDAASVARVATVPTGDAPAAVVWLCTDGFATAQADPAWRTLVAGQLLAQSATLGAEGLAERLPGWLEPAAMTGGDDTSMAVLVDTGRSTKRVAAEAPR